MTADNLPEDYLLKESLKKQILTELMAQENNIIPPEIHDGLVEEIRQQLIQELGRIEQNNIIMGDHPNPQQRNLSETLFQNPESAGYLEEVIKTLDTKTRSKIQSWLNIIGGGQSKGFLYGLGMAVLLSIIIPANGRKVQSVAYRTAPEGMDLIERARSIVAKIKEEIEDIIAEASYNSLQNETDDKSQFKTGYPQNSDQKLH